MSSRFICPSEVVRRLRKRGINVPSLAILLPTLGIVLSESLLFFGYVRYALSIHLVTLGVSVFAPLVADDDASMFQLFALLPVFRLVNLGMPVFFELTIYWFPLIYGPLIPAIYVVGQANDLVSLEAGWKAAVLWFPLALPASVFFGAVEYAILEPESLVSTWSMVQLILISVIMIGFVGLVEELLFRGVLQQGLQERIGTWPGILVASIIFGLMHSGYRVPEELFFAASLGVVFGVIYNRTDSLALVTIMHGFLNVFLFAVIPLQDSLQNVVGSVSFFGL